MNNKQSKYYIITRLYYIISTNTGMTSMSVIEEELWRNRNMSRSSKRLYFRIFVDFTRIFLIYCVGQYCLFLPKKIYSSLSLIKANSLS